MIIKTFRTEKNKYVYDAYSNKFFQFDDKIFDALNNGDAYLNEGSLEENVELKQAKEAGCFKDNVGKLPNLLHDEKIRKSLLRSTNEDLKSVILSPTDNCNLCCTYCSCWKRGNTKTRKSNTMEWEMLKKSIDYSEAHSKKTKDLSFSFFGGEPLINKELILRGMDYAKEIFTKNGRDVHFSITTNGTLLDEQIVREFCDRNVNISVSIDGGEEIHDISRRFANNDGSFKKIKYNLDQIIKKYPDYSKNKLRLNSVYNSGELWLTAAAISELLDEWGCENINGIRFVPKFTSGGNTPIPITSESINFYKKIHDDFVNTMKKGEALDMITEAIYLEDITRIHSRKEFSDIKYFLPTAMCIPGIDSLFISSGGVFHICEKLDSSLKIGDLNSGLDIDTLCEILMRWYKKQYDSCIQCWAMNFCSLCLAHMKNLDFKSFDVTPICQNMKSEVLSDMITYCTIRETNDKAFDSVVFI
jgi:uncharacterized protein